MSATWRPGIEPGTSPEGACFHYTIAQIDYRRIVIAPATEHTASSKSISRRLGQEHVKKSLSRLRGNRRSTIYPLDRL